MTLPPLSKKPPPLITYQIEDGETFFEAISEAFGAIGLDVYGQETAIADWTQDGLIDLSVLDPDGPVRVSTVIWDHPVVVTPDEIRIYEQL